MKEKIEVELAMKQYKVESPTLNQIEQIRKRIAELKTFYMADGAAEELAYEQAVATIDAGMKMNVRLGNSVVRKERISAIKATCREKKAGSIVRAEQVLHHMREKMGYEGSSANGIGTLMGRGNWGDGLFMEPGEEFQKRVGYKVPDPVKFADWYENDDAILPRSYYSDDYWEELFQREAANPKSKFFEKHAAKNQNS